MYTKKSPRARCISCSVWFKRKANRSRCFHHVYHGRGSHDTRCRERVPIRSAIDSSRCAITREHTEEPEKSNKYDGHSRPRTPSTETHHIRHGEILRERWYIAHHHTFRVSLEVCTISRNRSAAKSLGWTFVVTKISSRDMCGKFNTAVAQVLPPLTSLLRSAVARAMSSCPSLAGCSSDTLGVPSSVCRWDSSSAWVSARPTASSRYHSWACTQSHGKPVNEYLRRLRVTYRNCAELNIIPQEAKA